MFEATKQAELGSLCTAIKDGTHGTHPRVSTGVPLLSAKNISGSGSVIVDDGDDLISEKEYEMLSKNFPLKKGDVLLTVVGSLGRAAIFNGEKVAFQRSVAFFRPDNKRLLPRFLFHLVRHDGFTRQLVQRSNATAQAGIYLGELARCRVPDFSLCEQDVIATIFDTLDTQIRQTEVIIAKLKQVKQGLLHDLLTRGIDANGQLRPPREQAPELYKESPLGWMPREWEVTNINGLATNLDGKRIPIRGSERKFGDYPYYGASGIIDWVDDYIFDGDYALLGEDGENVNSRNIPLAFRATGKIWVNNHAHIYSANEDVDVRFLVEVLEDKDYRPFISGSAQPKLTQANLMKVLFVKPPLVEQTMIVETLGEHDRRVDQEKKMVAKLKKQKSGLMDDLLTGRVRVTSLLDTAKAS